MCLIGTQFNDHFPWSHESQFTSISKFVLVFVLLLRGLRSGRGLPEVSQKQVSRIFSLDLGMVESSTGPLRDSDTRSQPRLLVRTCINLSRDHWGHGHGRK